MNIESIKSVLRDVEKRNGLRQKLMADETQAMTVVYLPGLCRDELGRTFEATYHRALNLAVEEAPAAFLMQAVHRDHRRVGYSVGFLDSEAADRFRRRTQTANIRCE